MRMYRYPFPHTHALFTYICDLYIPVILPPSIETAQSRSELTYALKDTAQTLAAVTGERDRLLVQVDKVSIPYTLDLYIRVV